MVNKSEGLLCSIVNLYSSSHSSKHPNMDGTTWGPGKVHILLDLVEGQELYSYVPGDQQHTAPCQGLGQFLFFFFFYLI